MKQKRSLYLLVVLIVATFAPGNFKVGFIRSNLLTKFIFKLQRPLVNVGIHPGVLVANLDRMVAMAINTMEIIVMAMALVHLVNPV